MENREAEIMDAIAAALEDGIEPDLMLRMEISSVRTFEDAGILTLDEGLVITTTDGAEFQVTIKRSR